MNAILRVKNSIRDFCRKKDEIISPALKFIWGLIVFMSIRKMFGYNSLANKSEVVILLAVLCALLPDGFMFFMAGIVMALHSFTVAWEVGAVYTLIFIMMYCIYVRFFPNYAYAVLMVPVFYILNIPFAAPIIIALVASFGGMVPAAFGVVIYYFSQSVDDIAKMLKAETAENEIEAFKELSHILIGNKDMYTTMFIFVLVVLVTSVLAKFTYDFAIYIAIAGGTIFTILGAILAGYIMNQNVSMPEVLLGSLIGAAIAMFLRFGQGILDYKHTERVQFEDDDYYYYVKAVPKIDSEKIKVDGESKKNALNKKRSNGKGHSNPTPNHAPNPNPRPARPANHGNGQGPQGPNLMDEEYRGQEAASVPDGNSGRREDPGYNTGNNAGNIGGQSVEERVRGNIQVPLGTKGDNWESVE